METFTLSESTDVTSFSIGVRKAILVYFETAYFENCLQIFLSDSKRYKTLSPNVGDDGRGKHSRCLPSSFETGIASDILAREALARRSARKETL